MEGNGPIQGTSKACGALIFGDDPVAVDATCCRLMGLMPERIKYLAAAGTMLGHVKVDKIQQVGENIANLCANFEVVPEFGHLRDVA
jgi:uncharacterized protein (DUF362 family)